MGAGGWTHVTPFGRPGVAGVELLCCLSTLSAVPFYRAMGFGTGAEVALHLTPEVVFPAVEMRRALTD